MRFGDKQLTAICLAARQIYGLRGVPRGMEDVDPKDLKKAIVKMEAEIERRAVKKKTE
mgnify:CR=1 FL=1